MLRRIAPFADDLVRHRDLLWQFTLRNVELRHKGSHLGLAWSLLNPLLMLGVYVLVFGYIFGGRFGFPGETKTTYGLAIFLGLTIYHFVAESLASAPGVVVAQPNFVKKVVFPLEILPAANLGAAVVHLFIGLLLVLGGVVVVGDGLTWAVLWLPVILLPLILGCLGLGWLLSAIGVFLRDISHIVQFLTLVLMFASAVFYPIQKIPASAWTAMRFNPVLIAIEAARDCVIWHEPVNSAHLTYLYLVGFGTCYAGHALFRHLKPAFADVL